MKRSQLVEELSKNINDDGKLILWGTGNTAALYIEGIKRINLFEKVYGFADNDESKWGNYFYEKKIYSCEDLLELGDVFVLIVSPNPKIINSVGKQLEDKKIRWMHIDKYIFCKYKDEVLESYDLLEDDYSKNIYSEIIMSRMMGKYPDVNIIDREQYFSFEKFIDHNPKEVFIDCGAYVGDSIERYIWNTDGSFKKIIGFEPDKSNFTALNARLNRLKTEWNISDEKIIVYPYGISDYCEVNYVERYVNNNGFGSRISKEASLESDECKVVSIDDFIQEEVGFIKADIESFEYRLIEGSKNTIKRYNPKLAICIYHNAADMFQIPSLIKRINPQYKLAVRHYTCTLAETVLYAYMDI